MDGGGLRRSRARFDRLCYRWIVGVEVGVTVLQEAVKLAGVLSPCKKPADDSTGPGGQEIDCDMYWHIFVDFPTVGKQVSPSPSSGMACSIS